MADIKTRDAVKGTIKTIDKAAIASERMKAAYAKTKDKAEQGYYADESSATEYASDKVSYTAERVTEEGVHQFNKQGKKGVQTTKENIVKAKDKIADFKTKRAVKAAEQKQAQAASEQVGSAVRRGAESRSAVPDMPVQTIKTKRQTEKTIKQSVRSTGKTVKTAAKGTVKSAEKSVKTAQSTSKAAIKTAEHTAKTAQKTAQASVKAAQRAAQAAKATAKATAHAVKVAVKATIAAVKAIIAGTKALISAIPLPKYNAPDNQIILKGEITSPINVTKSCRFAPRCVYAKPECFENEPQLEEIEKDHFVKCHFVREINGL